MRVKRAMVCEHHAKSMIDTCLLCKIAKLNKEVEALKSEMETLKGNYKMHPFWKTASAEKLRGVLEFQGAMTSQLIPFQDGYMKLRNVAQKVVDAHEPKHEKSVEWDLMKELEKVHFNERTGEIRWQS